MGVTPPAPGGNVRKIRAPDPPVPVPLAASIVRLAPTTFEPVRAAPLIVGAITVPVLSPLPRSSVPPMPRVLVEPT